MLQLRHEVVDGLLVEGQAEPGRGAGQLGLVVLALELPRREGEDGEAEVRVLAGERRQGAAKVAFVVEFVKLSELAGEKNRPLFV